MSSPQNPDAIGGYFVPNRWVPHVAVAVYADQRRARGERPLSRTEENRIRRKIKRMLYHK